VNPLHTLQIERCKPTQLVVAERCGLRIPATLISNDPEEIRSFFRAAGNGRVIYKTFNAFVPTSLLTEELLSDADALRWTPGIYQHYVEKDHELRVTVIGSRLFAVRIFSQSTVHGTVDWREAQWAPEGESSDLTFEPATLPKPVRDACRRLIRRLGLVYGAIDLIVTPGGEHVFLEVNPSGQFLWIEDEVGLPLLDAMSEMLIQGTPTYRWNPRSPRVRFDAEFLEATKVRVLQSLAEHVCEVQR
jgi:glutathione synthase/RimK-type ligase-like ATP-grasp enzyme